MSSNSRDARDEAKTSTVMGAGKKLTPTSSDERGSEISGDSHRGQSGHGARGSAAEPEDAAAPPPPPGRAGAGEEWLPVMRAELRQKLLLAKVPARCRNDSQGPRRSHEPRTKQRQGGEGSPRDGRSAAGETPPAGIAGCTETAGDGKRLSVQQTSLLRSESCHSHPAPGDHHPARRPSRH